MQENRSFDSYFGTYPGADGIPMRNGVPTVCVPNPVTNGCQRPYHDTADRNAGGPHDHSDAVADINGGKMNGFIKQARLGRQALVRVERRHADVLARAEVARRDGLPRLARDPELLEVRAQLRAPGPHVPAGSLVEPAGAPVHGLRVVGEVLEEGRPDELRPRDPGTGLAAGRAAEHDRRGPRLRVDRPHVSPPQGPRELALLRLQGLAAGLRRRRDVLPCRRAEREDAGDLESAAVLRHGAAGRPAVERRAVRLVPEGGADRDAAGGVVADRRRRR